jgi:hypothetical protein
MTTDETRGKMSSKKVIVYFIFENVLFLLLWPKIENANYSNRTKNNKIKRPQGWWLSTNKGDTNFFDVFPGDAKDL